MTAALVLSGGNGSRLGARIPKQYIEVKGKPIILYCLECLAAHDRIDWIQIVADPVWQGSIREWIRGTDIETKFRGFSLPGETRQLSILHGLEDIALYASEADTVLIHDAARPFVSEETITDCVIGATTGDGAMPALPMKDTVYQSTDGKRVTALLNRSEIYAGQAPEAYRLGKYLEANRALLPERILRINGSTESAILAGMDIRMIPGDERNFKITTQADLERFREIVGEKD